ncbi:MAG: TonB-dependent receptor [Alphaproteobacteria bacterium]|nr:TonB-dependent receptor [Alphaproteobacteria bacterium]
MQGHFRQHCGKLVAFSFMLPIYFLSQPASAAKDFDYFDLPLEQLLNVEVISASKTTQKVSDAAAAVFIITQEDIQRSGVHTIPDALRMAPGVEVAQADSNSWAVSIRGFNSVTANKILVMIDGRTVYNPLFAGTYWELQDLLMDDIDRIEVVRGPGGTLWGANAVNGVINIITKDTRATQGNLVTGLYGNEERGTIGIRHGGSFAPGNYYRMYGKFLNRDSFRKPGGDNTHDDWKSYRSGFRMDWDSSFTLQGDLYRTVTDQLNSTPILTAPYALIEEETMDSKGANILGRWKKETDNGGLLTLQSYIDYTNREQILLKDHRTIWDFESQYNLPKNARHEVVTGAGYRYMRDNLGDGNGIMFDPSSRQDSLYHLFLQDRITLSPNNWYLTLGSKFEHNEYTGFEYQPNARLQWQIDPSQMAWSSVSRAVRTPSRLEHDLDDTISVARPGVFGPGATEIVVKANPDFNAEELTAYEAGYRKQLTPDLSVDIAAFYNDYDNLATYGFLTPSPGMFPVQIVNGMTGETWGAELASSWRVTPSFKISGTYTFLNMFLHVRDNHGYNLETAEDISPHHQASLRASWNIHPRLSLDTSAYYVDQLSQADVHDYVRLDLNLGWRIDDTLRVNLTGQNLLQDSHREFSSPTALNAAEVERSVFGKMTWEF